MLEERTNLRSKDIKRTQTYGKRQATMDETHQVIGTYAAHISWNLRSRDSAVELGSDVTFLSYKTKKKIKTQKLRKAKTVLFLWFLFFVYHERSLNSETAAIGKRNNRANIRLFQYLLACIKLTPS